MTPSASPRNNLAADKTFEPLPGTRATLARLVRLALLLRLSTAVLLHLFLRDEAIAPDQLSYHYWGDALAGYWWDERPDPPAELSRGSRAVGYIYVLGLLYATLGSWALLPKLLNCFIGTMLVPITFRLTKKTVGDEAAAIRAARYVAFFPSMVLWSALNVRDCWVAVFICASCLFALDLQDRPTAVNVTKLSACILGVMLFRSYLLFALVLPMFVSLLVRGRARLGRNVALGMILASVVIYADAAAGRDRALRTVDLESLQSGRNWSANYSGSGFGRDADVSTIVGALSFLPVGLAYFLFAPFPWAVQGFKQLLTVPEMLFFYSLVPAMARGIMFLVRRHLTNSLMVLLLAAGMTLGYAVGQSNVGTIYRHRTQVLPLYLVFCAIGVGIGRHRASSSRARPSLRSDSLRRTSA